MEPIDDDDRKHFLDVVHEACEHSDDDSPDEEERRVNLDLAHQGSGGLVFPDHVEVRFEASECEDECHKKTAGTDEPEFTNRNVFRVFNDIHNLLGWPVQIEHVNHDGEVVRNEITEPDRKSNGGEHDEERDDCYKRCIGQGRGTGHAVVIQERLSCDNHNLYKSR